MAGKTIEGYVADVGGWRGDVVRDLCRLVDEAAPGVSSSIKWGQPVWESNGPFAYVKAFPASVNFGFWRGAQLDDPDGLLDGEGDRMKHVKIRSVEDVRPDTLRAFVIQAVELNATLGNPTKRR